MRLRIPTNALLVILATAVGALAALGAATFQTAIARGPALWASLEAQVGGGIVVLLPALGGLGCGLLAHWALREGQNAGVPSIVEAVALRGGRFPVRPAAVRIVSAVLTLISGGSAGSAGPNALIGATIASGVGKRLRLSERQLTTLLACGAASGISAAFNTPIAGVLFSLEVILGELSEAALGAIILSSVVAALVNHTLRGDFPMFRVPSYPPSSPWEVLFCLGLGALAAVIGPLNIVASRQIARLLGHARLPDWLKPTLGGAMVGLVALGFPQVRGTGSEVVESVMGDGTQASIALLLTLATLKPLITSVTLTSGGAGGIFAPSLFAGAMLGRAYGMAIEALFPSLAISPGAYAMVGMGAALSGAAHAPMTATLLLFEMTRDYRILLPLMLGTLVSQVVAQRLNVESVYTAALARRGIYLRQGRDVNVMEQLRVQEVMRENWIAVEGDLPLPKLGEYLEEHTVNALPVVDDRGQLAGMVNLQAYQNALPSEQHSAMRVTDIAMQNVPTLYADQTLNDAMSLFAVSDVDLLPVVSRQNRQEIVGIVERSDIVDAYRRALVRREEIERWVQATQSASDSEGSTLSLVLPDEGGAVGWSLRDLDLGRYQAVVVRIQRGAHPAQSAGIMPRGDTILQGSDRLTIALADPPCASTVRELLLDGVGLDPSQRTDRARIAIPSDTPWPLGRRVRELPLRRGVLLVRVRRGGQLIIPHGDTTLYPGDVVEAVGKEGDLAALKAYLESS